MNQTHRPTVPALEEWFGRTTQVLDHGIVRLVDYMGDDAAIVQAARVSYGAGTKTVREDRGLIRYLMRHRHSTPFEMCLSGDTQIPTFTTGGATVKHYAIRELARAFEEGGRANSWAKLVRIRTVNPATGVVTSTGIRRAWRTGVRPTYEVTVGPFQRKITVTDNHPFLCDDGQYRTLEEIGVGSRVALNGIPATSAEVREEVLHQRRRGASISVISQSTGIAPSTVWKISKAAGLGGRVARRTGFLKKPVGEHRDPRAIARRRVAKGNCAICDEKPGQDVHHLDENPHNNEPSNLLRLCPKHHRHIHTRSTLERVFFAEITSVTFKGEQEVFDLEVVSDNHNFVADGFVVHNCELKLHVKLPIFVARQWIRHRMASVNEYSARYSILDREFYLPDPAVLASQAQGNKQGRGATLSPVQAAEVLDLLRRDAVQVYSTYEQLLNDSGDGTPVDDGAPQLARELARMDLTLNYYTQWYWKIDLHNLLHFLSLRLDAHAQHEIRVYAEVIADIVEAWVPHAWEAFEDYRFGAVTLSRQDLWVVRKVLSGIPLDDALEGSKLSAREQADLRKVLE